MTIPAKWKNREIYETDGDIITDVRLAYTRATILTAVQKSEKQEKVKKDEILIKNGPMPEWVPKSHKTKSLARGSCGQRGTEDGIDPKTDQN